MRKGDRSPIPRAVDPDSLRDLPGQLVADLTPARTESQLTRALDQILTRSRSRARAQQLEAEVEPLIAMGEDVHCRGDPDSRRIEFREADGTWRPEYREIISGLARPR
jgi:putative thioredoxin